MHGGMANRRRTRQTVEIGGTDPCARSAIRKTWPGFPTTIALQGTLFVTTLPAPTNAFSPTVTPARMVAPDPIDAPFLISVVSSFQSSSVCNAPSAFVARGYLSLMKTTPCPTNTSSSIMTPSQTKVWLEILQFFPTLAFFWISTNAPIFVPSPISQPYRLMNFDSLTSLPSLTSGAMQQYSAILVCTRAKHHSSRRLQQNLDITQQRPRSGIVEVHAHHVIELYAASALHLPEPGNARLHCLHSAAVPDVVSGILIGDRRPRTHQGHLAYQHIEELWQLVQAGSAQEPAQRRNSRICSQLVDWSAVVC